MKAFKIFSLSPVIVALIIPLFYSFTFPGELSDTILTKADAEKIMGEPVTLTEEKKEVKDGIIKNSSTYSALHKTSTNSPIALYTNFQEFKDADLAKKAYTAITKSNAQMTGHSSVSGIGDQAWYHTDGVNFGLIMVRKNEKLLIIKVSKTTKTFSRDELMSVCKRLMK